MLEMKIIPIILRDANSFVEKYHRHNKKCKGHLFAVGLENETGKLIGVAICGRANSRHLDNKFTLEILRVCTDGTRNANSKLYSACKRIGQAWGYEKFITYTLQSESQSSLKAIGARIEKNVKHKRDWNDSKKVIRKKNSISRELKYRWAI